MKYIQIIRADGSSRRYSSMIRMLQNIDKKDLETLGDANNEGSSLYKLAIMKHLVIDVEPLHRMSIPSEFLKTLVTLTKASPRRMKLLLWLFHLMAKQRPKGFHKNPLVLDMRSEIKTLQGKVDKLHGMHRRLVLEDKKWITYKQILSILYSKVKGLESERERLKSSETQLLQEIDRLRQDKAVVVSKVVPHMATKLFRNDEMGLLVTRLVKATMFRGTCNYFVACSFSFPCIVC
ncbi:hypothetical protein Tco_0228312 [Tanacetum coccineum]